MSQDCRDAHGGLNSHGASSASYSCTDTASVCRHRCVCIEICIHTYIHMYIYIYIYIYLHLYIYSYVLFHMCIYIHIYDVCIHTYSHVTCVCLHIGCHAYLCQEAPGREILAELRAACFRLACDTREARLTARFKS